MSDDDEVDNIMPIRGYDPVAAYAEITAIGGKLLQQRTRFEQVTDRQIDSMCMIDSRFGGVDRRLDKLEARLEDVDAKLAQLLAILEAADDRGSGGQVLDHVGDADRRAATAVIVGHDDLMHGDAAAEVDRRAHPGDDPRRR